MAFVARGFAARGFKVQTLQSSQDDFFDQLIRICGRDKPFVLAGAFHFDATISASFLEARRNLFQALGITVFATLFDHPFSYFVRPRIQAAHREAIFRINDPGHEAAARLVNPTLTRFHRARSFASLPALAPQPARDHTDRDIDLLVPINLVKPQGEFEALRAEAEALKPHGLQILDDVFETLCSNPNASPLVCFAGSVTLRLGEDFFALPRHQPLFGDLLSLLSRLDSCARVTRRCRFLAELSRIHPSKKVVITSAVPGALSLPTRNNLVIKDYVPFSQLSALQARARWVMNVNPSFPDDVSTRILNALGNGAAVMTDANREIDRVFGTDGGLGYLTQASDVASLVNDTSPAQSQARADKAQALVEKDYGEEQYYSGWADLFDRYQDQG